VTVQWHGKGRLESFKIEKVRRTFFLPLTAVFLIACGLVVYSQTAAFAFDEGFHLLAAQLILHGKRPYLDFLFAQAPLNAYWNALWMRILTDNWRVAHALAAVQTAAAVALTADYVFRRLPERTWNVPASLFVACAVGLNVAVVQFGTVGQAYGLCMLLIVAAFRTTALAAGRGSLWLPALSGLLSAAAAESSLLCAPVAPVLLAWLLVANAAGRRLAKAGAFAAGALIASIPLLRLFVQSPRQVLFSVFQYHFLFREVEWPDAFQHNLSVSLGWVDSGQALLLVLLASGGVLYVWRCGWDRSVRMELYLCGALAVALAAHLLSARPTFERYFLLTVPFLSILASVGVCALGERLSGPGKPAWTAGVACLLMVLGLTRTLFEGRDDFVWKDAEVLADEVNSITPQGAPLYADEIVYFVARRMPPAGMEYRDSHKLKSLPPSEAAYLHIVPSQERDRMIEDGAFPTVESCDEDEISRFVKLYSNKAEHADCAVFWGYR
jgi:hypothetical protein